jgi:hypothetical protein
MITSVSRLRAFAVAATVLTTAALAASACPAGSAGATPTTRMLAAAPAVSTTHPFSDPVYYPLHAAMWMNCVRHNPGCNHDKGFWSIDMVVPTKNAKVGVYAMGAGIVHVQVAHGTPCPSSTSSFGTSIWIDHGVGVVSRYGHFASLSVHTGEYVAVGQLLGLTGTTGKRSNCVNTYLDYEVLHHGLGGTPAEIKTTRACAQSSSAHSSTWPTALNSSWTTWDKVPMGGHPPNKIPAAYTGCLPSGAPKTPGKPSGVSITRSGSGSLTVHWTHATTSSVVLQFGAYKSGKLPAVQNLTYLTVAGSKTSYKLTHLRNGTKYGVKISFHNSVGFGRPSSIYTGTPV